MKLCHIHFQRGCSPELMMRIPKVVEKQTKVDRNGVSCPPSVAVLLTWLEVTMTVGNRKYKKKKV